MPTDEPGNLLSARLRSLIGQPIGLYGDDLDGRIGRLLAFDAEWLEIECADGDRCVIRLASVGRIDHGGATPAHWQHKLRLNELDGGRGLRADFASAERGMLQAIERAEKSTNGPEAAISDPEGFLRSLAEMVED
jgi:hypothetical protein